MNLLRFIPVKLTLLLILGIVLGKYINLPLPYSLMIAASFLLLLALNLFRSKDPNSIFFGILMTSTIISIGLLSYSIWQPQNWNDHYSNFEIKEGNTLRLKIREILKPNTYSNRYIAQVEQTNADKTSGKIILSLPIDSTQNLLQVDDELLTYGTLTEIKPPLNPHQFDYKKYLQNLGISKQLKGSKNSYFLSKTSTITVYGFAATIRNKFIQKLEGANFGENELGIIQALLLGQRNSISAETYDNYKDAGAVHILAVSGLHIGILLLLLQFLLTPIERLPKGKSVKLAVIVLLLWCFALIAGFSASVVRAVTMFSFVAYALYLNRPSNTFNILALSMFFILLLFNPMLLFQVGFQMSYVAVFSIVWVYPLLQRFWHPKHRVVRKIWQLLSVSFAAQLGVLPISLFYFHQFPGLFFISNLLIVPFLGILLGMGILVLVLALCNVLPDFLVDLYNGMVQLMNTVIEWVAQQEAFIFKNISFDGVQLVIAYAAVILMVGTLTKPSFKRTVALLTAVIGFQSWMLFSTFDTSQGEVLLLIHQNRNSIVFHQQGNQLTVHATNTETNQRTEIDFMVGERIEEVGYQDLKNSYSIGDKYLLVIDSTGVYTSKKRPEYLLLTQSTKLNLERLIDSIQPKKILADGSNYRSAVERWRKTCIERKLSFHYTGEKGAYYFE
jgi:competence protein ComEC